MKLLLFALAVLLSGGWLSACTTQPPESDRQEVDLSLEKIYPLDCPHPLTSLPGSGVEVCYLSLEDSPFSVLFTENVDPDRVVLLDPGGPHIVEQDAVDVLNHLMPNVLDTEQVVLLFLADPQEITPECAESSNETFAQSCNASDLSRLYLQDYARALATLLEPSDSQGAVYLDVAGSSFAGARWNWITRSTELPDPRFIAIADPLKLGVEVAALRRGRGETSEEQYYRLLNGCPVDRDCSQPSTDASPLALVSSITGFAPDYVEEGLAGMLPAIELNRTGFEQAIAQTDHDYLRDYVDRGVAQLRERNAFGERTVAGVHNTSAVCSILDSTGESGGYLDGWLSECSSFPDPERVPWGQEEGLEVSQSAQKSTVCFLPSDPDPVLGWANRLGKNFGVAVQSEVQFQDYVEHGHIESAWLAAQRSMPAAADVGGKACGTAFTGQGG